MIAAAAISAALLLSGFILGAEWSSARQRRRIHEAITYSACWTCEHRDDRESVL